MSTSSRFNNYFKRASGVSVVVILTCMFAWPIRHAPAEGVSNRSAPPAAYRTLLDIYNNRDAARIVTANSSRSLKIGVDHIKFTLQSSHPGYLYVLMLGTDGKTFDLLFPNRLDVNNKVHAGEPIALPRASWTLKAIGPAGNNYLLALIADTPRDFSQLGMQAAGVFSIVAANAVTSRDIQRVVTASGYESQERCVLQPQHGAVRDPKCSMAYGAALVVIEEVE